MRLSNCPSKLHRRIPDFEDFMEQRTQNVLLIVFILLSCQSFNYVCMCVLVHLCASSCVCRHVYSSVWKSENNLGCGSSGAVHIFLFLFLFLTVSCDLELTDAPGLSGQVVSSRCLPVLSASSLWELSIDCKHCGN